MRTSVGNCNAPEASALDEEEELGFSEARGLHKGISTKAHSLIPGHLSLSGAHRDSAVMMPNQCSTRDQRAVVHMFLKEIVSVPQNKPHSLSSVPS